MPSMLILGITGTDGAGKGTAVDYLVKELGFAYYSARELWIEEIKKNGWEENRPNMRRAGNKLRGEYGSDYFAKECIRRVREAGHEKAVLESFRAIAEAEYLKQQGGVLLAIDADQKLRYERIQSRASTSDNVTFEEFMEQEALEMDDPDPNGMQKAQVIAMADYTIMNNEGLAELQSKIDEMLQSIENT